MSPNSNFTIFMYKYTEGARGVDGTLNRVNQTESATFNFCRVGLSLGIIIFSIAGMRKKV
jgi:hypothetical protein